MVKRNGQGHTNIFLRVAIVLLFLGLAIWALSLSHFNLVIAYSEPWLWLTDALIQVGPELAGIVIGVVTIDYLNERRQDEQLKEQLILQMGSSHNDVTDTAVRALRARGWLSDGSLRGADLHGANLNGALLYDANLSGASLWRANLSGASLWRANLRGAYLQMAYLDGAKLHDVNLSGALLQEANLSGADLHEANLSGARLWSANLSGARLERANLSGADLHEANLNGADLEVANLSGARLEGADLSGTLLRAADLGEANLSGARHWTIEQLKQIYRLEGAIMPNGVQLGRKATRRAKAIEGPTWKEWKAQYLARQDVETRKATRRERAIEGPTWKEWRAQYLARQDVETRKGQTDSAPDGQEEREDGG